MAYVTGHSLASENIMSFNYSTIGRYFFAGILLLSFNSISQVRELSQEVEQLENRVDFKSYFDEYYDDLESESATKVRCKGIVKRASQSRFIFVGDNHVNDESSLLAQQFIHQIKKKKRDQKVTLVLESVRHEHQMHLNSFLEEKLSSAELKRKIGFLENSGGWKWENVIRLLEFAKSTGTRVLAGESPPINALNNRYKERDKFAAEVIAKDAIKNPQSKYVILYGTSHLLGKDHLPDQLQKISSGTQSRIINFLGRKSQQVLDQTSEKDIHCAGFSKNIFYMNKRPISQNLAEYRDFLSSVARKEVGPPTHQEVR